MTHLLARLSGALLLVLLLAAPAQAAEVIPATVVDGAVVWTPSGDYATARLTLSSPSGLEYSQSFGAAEALRIHPAELGDEPLPNGFYAYELVVVRAAPDTDEPQTATSQAGTLEVREGAIVDSPLLDQVILDDLIVDGSLCVGLDCVNGESFGFDTIRLKENNVRIRFFDTSTTSSFPSNDWELTANESTNGGLNKFSITDVTAGRIPFTVEAGAPSHSLYVDDAGRIGLGTNAPVVEIDVRDGDSPTLRLAQDGSSGFTAQSWDVAGNEAGFFIRDATNGSTLPFRIRPNSPSSSLDMNASGVTVQEALFVGFNAGASARPSGASQTSVFEVNGDVDGDGDVNGTGDLIGRFRSNLRVDGRLDVFEDMFVRANYTSLGINPVRVRSLDLNEDLMRLDASGNLEILGTLTESSDVNRKENIVPVDPQAILDGVLGLPISRWEYIADADDSVHLGPMAQDFFATFGLGRGETTISTVDKDGVALASIQALAARNEAATARIAELEEANAALEARLARLEALLGADRTDHE